MITRKYEKQKTEILIIWKCFFHQKLKAQKVAKLEYNKLTEKEKSNLPKLNSVNDNNTSSSTNVRENNSSNPITSWDVNKTLNYLIKYANNTNQFELRGVLSHLSKLSNSSLNMKEYILSKKVCSSWSRRPHLRKS